MPGIQTKRILAGFIVTAATLAIGIFVLAPRYSAVGDFKRNVASPHLRDVQEIWTGADSSLSQGYDVSLIGQCQNRRCQASTPLLTACATPQSGCRSASAADMQSQAQRLTPISGAARFIRWWTVRSTVDAPE
jgi:hypothetical protein